MVRVGRLLPLPGVSLRPNPERGQVQQFLHALALPLAAMQTMLEVGEGDPQSRAMAMRAASSQAEYLAALVADFAELGRLEADAVQPQAEAVTLADWLAQQGTVLGEIADLGGNELQLVHRSLLPSHVQFDAVLAARALTAVLRVAASRAHPGPIDLRIAYQHSMHGREPSQLGLEIVTRGGGYAEVEQGHVFTPFLARDAASRPLLGLSIAHGLAELLGGSLRVVSPGASVCTYTLTLLAPPTATSRWLDPMAALGGDLGPVQAGRVVCVGTSREIRLLGVPLLQRAGYEVRICDDASAALALVANGTTCGSVVLDASLGDRAAAQAVSMLREHGFRGAVVRVVGAVASTASSASGFDSVLPTPCSGRELLAALQATVRLV